VALWKVYVGCDSEKKEEIEREARNQRKNREDLGSGGRNFIEEEEHSLYCL
jgi:hypothetical protein